MLQMTGKQPASSKYPCPICPSKTPELSLLHVPPDKSILDIFDIPELHIILGVTDKLIKTYEQSFNSPEEGFNWLTRFLKSINLSINVSR